MKPVRKAYSDPERGPRKGDAITEVRVRTVQARVSVDAAGRLQIGWREVDGTHRKTTLGGE